MDSLARKALERLLALGEKDKAGLRSLKPALTAQHLQEYQALRLLSAKENFEATLKMARAAGAVSLAWKKGQGEEGFIQRVDLIDLATLARLLGVETMEAGIDRVRARFAPLIETHPVLNDVLARWGGLKKARGSGHDNAQDWVDAAKVVAFVRGKKLDEARDEPIREVSARLFKDSKRIEKLSGPLDVLLTGDIDTEIREPLDVWGELGLFREEQPVRLAGHIELVRTRVTAMIDAPYGAFPATSVIRLASVPDLIMTIENQTTFHSEARRRCEENILLIYTAGMPSPAWRAMYAKLLGSVPKSVPVHHWGDVDEGGFRIATVLAEAARAVDHELKPWKMAPEDVPADRRTPAKPHTLVRIRHFARMAGWEALGNAVAEAGFTVEQEGLVPS